LSRRTKLIILIGYLIILIVSLFAYKLKRAKKEKTLKAAISQINAEKDKKRRGELELKKIMGTIPLEVDTTAIVSSLYTFAKDSGLKSHDVSTEGAGGGDKLSARAATKANKDGLKKSRFRIAISGGFRNMAEYVRNIQNMERFNKIIEMKFSADKDSVVKGNIVVEYYSLADKL